LPSSNISAARVARFEELRGRPAGLPDWPFGKAALGLALLFPLFFAAKYQPSFHLVRSLSTGHRRSRTDMKHEHYGNFSVARTATEAWPLSGDLPRESDGSHSDQRELLKMLKALTPGDVIQAANRY
jgi:hypothetical protein